MSKTLTFDNGKARLDYCYLCNESKAAIKYSQSIKDPIYCGAVDYFGEVEWEADRHVFVVDEKKYLADIEAENHMYDGIGDFMNKIEEHEDVSR